VALCIAGDACGAGAKRVMSDWPAADKLGLLSYQGLMGEVAAVEADPRGVKAANITYRCRRVRRPSVEIGSREAETPICKAGVYFR
jgi:hypothetical protein